MWNKNAAHIKSSNKAFLQSYPVLFRQSRKLDLFGTIWFPAPITNRKACLARINFSEPFFPKRVISPDGVKFHFKATGWPAVLIMS